MERIAVGFRQRLTLKRGRRVSACFRQALLLVALCSVVIAPRAGAVPVTQRPAGLPPLLGVDQLRSLSTNPSNLVVAATRDPEATRILQTAGARLLSAPARLWLLSAGNSAALNSLATRDLLRYAHPDVPLPRRFAASPVDPPTDPLAGTQWWLSSIGANALMAPGPGVPLTVLDTGVDVTHPEFAGRQLEALNPQIPFDHPHGTMVSSVAAAPANGHGIVGVYPQAALRSIDVSGDTCSSTVAAVDLAINAPAPSALNMSWGFPDPRACPALYEEMIVALGVGHLPVASAGNYRQQGSPPTYPAALPHVLTVAATDQFDAVASFSNQDPGLDLAAPGAGIMAAIPTFFDTTGYTEVGGTSFSAPMVAAAAAWVWTQRRSEIRSPGQLADLMRYSARDTGPTGWDADTGFGVLSVPSALSARLTPPDPQEPNDDIDQVKAGGLFTTSTPPLTGPGRGRSVLDARVDFYEDPVDVYRAWLPRRRVLAVELRPRFGNVDVEVFRPNARTIYYQNRRAALRGALIGGSYLTGAKVDRFAVKNNTRRGVYVYVVAYKTGGAALDAGYRLGLRTLSTNR
jgi:Subtilase family